MALMFMMILSVAGIAIALSLYALFTPYFSLLKDIKNYNMAYYGANMAMERSFLVLRQQEAGFEGSGGRIGSGVAGPNSDRKRIPTIAREGDSVLWTIRSRTTASGSKQLLPGTFGGNDPYDQSMNTLTHGQTQRIPLWVDNTTPNNAYTKDQSRQNFSSSSLQLRVVRPTRLFSLSGFGSLCEDNLPTCASLPHDLDGDSVSNDVIVGWRFDGNYKNSPFTILPRQVIGQFQSQQSIGVQSTDATIRESSINTMSANPNTKVLFADSNNPIGAVENAASFPNNPQGHLMIGNVSVVNALKGSGFNAIFQNTHVGDLDLKLNLTNTLYAQGGQIYPFLSYQLIGDGNNPFSQPYFSLEGIGKVGDYTVTMKAIKPIDKQNLLSSFTVIF